MSAGIMAAFIPCRKTDRVNPGAQPVLMQGARNAGDRIQMKLAAETLEDRVRKRAYDLWETDGRPPNRGDEFWERARELIAIEDNPTAGQLPNPMVHGDPAGPEEPVEPIESVESQGEFPARLTDQGDRQAAPRRRSRKT
jgi:Protein of unknown function (DUF2934)